MSQYVYFNMSGIMDLHMNIGEAQEAPSEDAPLNPHVSAAELN
jgi:hypothetical protein